MLGLNVIMGSYCVFLSGVFDLENHVGVFSEKAIQKSNGFKVLGYTPCVFLALGNKLYH